MLRNILKINAIIRLASTVIFTMCQFRRYAWAGIPACCAR